MAGIPELLNRDPRLEGRMHRGVPCHTGFKALGCTCAPRLLVSREPEGPGRKACRPGARKHSRALEPQLQSSLPVGSRHLWAKDSVLGQATLQGLREQDGEQSTQTGAHHKRTSSASVWLETPGVGGSPGCPGTGTWGPRWKSALGRRSTEVPSDTPPDPQGWFPLISWMSLFSRSF